MLNGIKVKNFRSLHDAQFELKPITLLIGPNNSGKSSFISLLTTLKQTLSSRSDKSPLILEGPLVQLGSYRDVVYGHKIENEIEVELTFSKKGFSALLRRPPNSGENSSIFEISRFLPHSITFRVKYDERSETIFLKDLKVNRNEADSLISVENNVMVSLFNKDLKTPIEISSDKILQEPRTSRIFVTQRHFMWSVSMPLETKGVMINELWLRRYPNAIEEYFQEFLLYLGPLREYPKRYYISSGEKPSDVGLRGEKTIDYLYSLYEENIRKINYWFRKFEMAESITIEKLSPKASIWKVELKNMRTGSNDNLKDVGFGISQVLPIVTEGITAKKGTLLLIEQPEIHLHPKAQAELADLFIDLAKSDKTSVIETHSEHMMLRFARRIAEGELKREDIVLYEFTLDSNGTIVKRIDFDKNGNIEYWPAGFFETDLQETMQHLKAQTNKHSGEAENGDVGS